MQVRRPAAVAAAATAAKLKLDRRPSLARSAETERDEHTRTMFMRAHKSASLPLAYDSGRR